MTPYFICPNCLTTTTVDNGHCIDKIQLTDQVLQCDGKPVPAFLSSDLEEMLKERIKHWKDLDKDIEESYRNRINAKGVFEELESLLREVEGGK